MKKPKIKVGVIGVGSMGSLHARILSTLAEAELIGISDKDPARGKSVAEKYKTEFFPDYKDLLKKAEAVVIASPTETHYEISKAAIEQGLRTFIEKPLALTLEEAEKFVKLSQSKGVPVAVGHIERFNPAFEELKKRLGSAKILSIHAQRFSPFPERIKEVSVVLDMMTHDLDLALALGNSPVDNFQAFGQKIKSRFLDDVFAVITLKNGVKAKIEASRVHAEKVRKLSVVCEDKTYEADLLKRKLFSCSHDNKTNIPVEDHDQLEAELKDFLLNPLPRVTAKDGLKALKLGLEIERSCG